MPTSLALIEAAKVSIDIEIFILKADAAGQAIFERLAARAKEGVKVRLLIDGLGAIQTRSSALRALRRAGGSVAIFLPIWRFFRLNRSNLRNHRKIAVFDGERIFAGGRNIADEYTWARRPPQTAGPTCRSWWKGRQPCIIARSSASTGPSHPERKHSPPAVGPRRRQGRMERWSRSSPLPGRTWPRTGCSKAFSR